MRNLSLRMLGNGLRMQLSMRRGRGMKGFWLWLSSLVLDYSRYGLIVLASVVSKRKIISLH